MDFVEKTNKQLNSTKNNFKILTSLISYKNKNNNNKNIAFVYK